MKLVELGTTRQGEDGDQNCAGFFSTIVVFAPARTVRGCYRFLHLRWLGRRRIPPLLTSRSSPDGALAEKVDRLLIAWQRNNKVRIHLLLLVVSCSVLVEE